jgi:hypothetical protein
MRLGAPIRSIRRAINDKSGEPGTELRNPPRVCVFMQDMRFSRAIRVRFKTFGQVRTIGDAHEALDCLMYCWPADRGPRHRDALDACLKVIDGHRSTIDAETAFAEAAREADILELGPMPR